MERAMLIPLEDDTQVDIEGARYVVFSNENNILEVAIPALKYSQPERANVEHLQASSIRGDFYYLGKDFGEPLVDEALDKDCDLFVAMIDDKRQMDFYCVNHPSVGIQKYLKGYQEAEEQKDVRKR